MNHEERLRRAREVLDGLSVGDALGEAVSYRYYEARDAILSLEVITPGFLRHTDDTEMAAAIFETLALLRAIDEDFLAWNFANRYRNDPHRGYGRMARKILEEISVGNSWRTVSPIAFGGGSFGNGAAMRVGPVGAYFQDDLSEVALMAERSAKVTHYHPEGVAGAIAVSLAVAVASRGRESNHPARVREEIVSVLTQWMPEGATRQNLLRAFSLGFDADPLAVAREVGNGTEITAQDTVPFCIWNGARMIADYQEAFLSTAEAGGDCDTNCAIVGGIVAAFTGAQGIPESWRLMREPLPIRG